MEILRFKPTYKKEDGLVVIDDLSVPLPEGFDVKVQSIVIFPPEAKGGNHKHPRKEFFYSPGDLTLIYLDENGEKKEVSMASENGEYKLFVIPPDLPHVVVNQTDNEIVMVEFADEEQHDVEVVKLI